MILFLTRKYAPSTGGMETFSVELEKAYPGPHELVHFGHAQRDIVWALPRLLLGAFLRRRRVSVFHLGDGVLSVLAPWIRLFSRAPVVATFHALELTYPSRLLSWAVRRSLGSISHFVAVSDYTKQLLIDAGVAPEKITVIVHGADHLPAFEDDATSGAPSTVDDLSGDDARRRLAREQIYAALEASALGRRWSKQEWLEADVLVTVGRLVRRKGVAWFVENVFGELRRRRERPLLHLIVGSGPDHDPIASVIRDARLEENVFLLGRVDSALLDATYRAAQLFVMPNVPIPGDAEGFGFVAIEAASRGAVVVTSRLEGIPSAIHDGENGFLVRPEDPSAWLARLEGLLAHPEETAAFARRARVYTATHFRWADVGRRYAALFDSLVAERPDAK